MHSEASHARPYQLELFEAACRENIIAFLDTGSGKTLVSVLLIQYVAETLALAVSEDEQQDDAADTNARKKIVFLAPTVPLVAQQAVRIRQDTFLRVGEYSSDSEGALSAVGGGPVRWRSEMARQHVLVMTPMHMLNLLRHAFISIERDVALIVIDECHHAAKAHPYAQIMIEHYHVIAPGRPRPRILGMTASPIRGRVSSEDGSILRLDELQSTLDCRIVTITDRSQLDGVVPRAKELLVQFEPPQYPSAIEHVLVPNELDSPAVIYLRHYLSLIVDYAQQIGASVLNDAVAKRSTRRSLRPSLHQEQSTSTLNADGEVVVQNDPDYDTHPGSDVEREQIESLMVNLVTVYDQLGAWYAGLVAHEIYETYIREAALSISHAYDPALFQPSSLKRKQSVLGHRTMSDKRMRMNELSATAAITNDIVDDVPPPKPELSEIFDSDISSKAHALIRILCRHNQTYSNQQFASNHDLARAMIFVGSRWIATIISDMINILAPLHFPAVRCGYATGHGRNTTMPTAPRSGRDHRGNRAQKFAPARMNANYQRKIFDRFRQGAFNVLVVTSVAEEGIDVPSCRLVVAFDLFRTQTAYVQSRGRARDVNGATYVIMVPRGDQRILRSIAQARVAECVTHRLVPAVGDTSGSRIPDRREPADADENGYKQPGRTLTIRAGETDDMVAKLLLGQEEQPLITPAGASLRSTSSSSLLYVYLARVRAQSPELRVDPAYKLIKRHGESMPENIPWNHYMNIIKAQRENRVGLGHGPDDELNSFESLFPSDPQFGHIYSVTVPPNPSLPSGAILYSLPRWTVKLAMHHAAFEACKLLWQSDELDDYLLPKPAKPSQRKSHQLNRIAAAPGQNAEVHPKTGEPNEDSGYTSAPQAAHDTTSGDDIEDDTSIDVDVTQIEAIPKLPSAFEPNPSNESAKIDGVQSQSPPDFDAASKTCSSQQSSSVGWTRYLTVVDFEGKVYEDCLMHDVIDGLAARNLRIKNRPCCSRTALAICTAGPIPSRHVINIPFRSTSYPAEIAAKMSPWPNVAKSGLSMAKSYPSGSYVPTTFTAEQVAAISLFQIRIWDLALRRPKTIDPDLLNSTSRQPDPSGRLYEILPMVWSEVEGQWNIHWTFVDSVNYERDVKLYDWIAASMMGLRDNTSNMYSLPHALDMPLDHTESCHHRLFRTLSEIPSTQSNLIAWEKDSFMDKFVSDGRLDEMLAKQLVLTGHNHVKYWRPCAYTSKNAHEKFLLTRKNLDPIEITYTEYVHSQGYTVSHPDAFLFSVKGIPGVRNLFVKNFGDGRGKKADDGDDRDAAEETVAKQGLRKRNQSDKSEQHPERPLLLVAEACSVLPVTLQFFDKIHCIPSLLFRLDSYCLAADMDAQLALHTRCELPVPMKLHVLRTALMCPAAGEDVNYQRLETLGDGFLKFGATLCLFLRHASVTEGTLSQKRSAIVSNKNLFRVAMRNRLVEMITIAPFKPRNWAPYGMHRIPHSRCEKAVVIDKNETKRHVSVKMLADVVEAIIGAYYDACGQDVAYAVLDRLGVLTQPDIPRMLASLPTAIDQSCILIDDVFPQGFGESVEDVVALAQTMSDHVQTHLSYPFKNRRLLLEALTHPSIHTPSHLHYERLEFLGDAVLDCMITRHMFLLYPTASPAALSDLRQAAASNESFCRLAVSLNLHNVLRHSNSSLHLDIDTYVASIGASTQPMQEDNQENRPHPSVLATVHEGPKALSDAFEALAGAVFLDCGGRLDTTWSIYAPVLIPFLHEHATPEAVARSPIREFNEMLHARGVMAHEITFQYETKNGDAYYKDTQGNRAIFTPLFGSNGSNIVTCKISVLGLTITQSDAGSKNMAKRLASVSGINWLMQLDDEALELMKKRARTSVIKPASEVTSILSKKSAAVT